MEPLLSEDEDGDRVVGRYFLLDLSPSASLQAPYPGYPGSIFPTGSNTMPTDTDKTIIHTIQQLISWSFGAIGVVGSKSQNRQTHEACGFLAKQVMHARTILDIVDQKKNSAGAIQYDHSSLYCLVRVMFELDLVMYDLLIAHNSPEELVHKLDIWYLHTLTSQRSALRPSPLATSKIQELNVQIHDMVAKLETSPYFTALTGPEKQKVIRFLDQSEKGERFKINYDLKLLYSKAGYSTSTANSMYQYTSTYVHSAGYGLMQILTPNDEDPFAMCRAGIRFTQIILAITFQRFATVSGYPLNAEMQQILKAQQDLAKTV